MPKKNILVQVGTRMEQRERIVPNIDDEGHYLGEKTETYEVEVPVMEAQNVDMTPEEIAEMEKLAAEMPEPEITQEERLDQIESAMMELAEMLGGE